MGRLLSLVRGVETSIRSRLGTWMQEVSLNGDQASSNISTLQVLEAQDAANIAALQALNVLPDGTVVYQILIWDGAAWVPTGELLLSPTNAAFAHSLSYGGGRVFTKEPAVVTGATPAISVVPAGGFVASKSHVVVAIVHADDGTDRAEFRVTATLKSSAGGDAAGLDTPLTEVISATAGALTWAATVAVSAGALVMNGANATAGTTWTVNAQFSRSA